MFACKSTGDGWLAKLDLEFERRADATILARRSHLEASFGFRSHSIQRDSRFATRCCWHPPAGIAGGDELEISAVVGNDAHALLTIPGVGKWYRSAGPWASQKILLDIGAEGVLEWLPQESIVFDGAKAKMQTRVALAADASFIGWEVLCLGRRASGERFDSGALYLSTQIEHGGKPIWLERGMFEGGSTLLHSAARFAGYSVSATLLAVGGGLVPRCWQLAGSNSRKRGMCCMA